MNLAFILLLVVSSRPTFGQVCSSDNRLPENTDIAVTCGPRDIQLSIKVCPVLFANFDPHDLALNGNHNNTACLGTFDNSTGTPLMKFTLLLDNSSTIACGNKIEVLDEVGSGVFSSFSKVPTAVISGFVDTAALTEMGLVSYSTNLHYDFSCRYPMLYLLNNTELLTSFGAVAVNSNNGSFISTLQMEIFNYQNFSTPVAPNSTIYGLKQTIYVQVKSNNSATSYNVFLDRCLATPTAFFSPGRNDSYDFFLGCNTTQKVSIISNGVDKFARFSFPSFRWLQQSAQSASTIFLHCFTRLCEPDRCTKCPSTRRKREAKDGSTTDPVFVSFGPLHIAANPRKESSVSSGGRNQWSHSQTSLLMAFSVLTAMAYNIVANSLHGF